MKYFFITLVLISAASQTEGAVNVTIYYESLCPDSVDFITNQLWTTYQDIGDLIQIDFVPFGKASWTENPWSITCQHGPRECHGNAIQACALEKYNTQEMKVNYVNCLMSEKEPDKAGATCAERLGYSYEGIDECAVGEEGRKLHMKYGEKTKNFKPPITFIPTVAINNVYNQKDQQLALSQFKQLVCSKFPQGEKPPACRAATDTITELETTTQDLQE